MLTIDVLVNNLEQKSRLWGLIRKFIEDFFISQLWALYTTFFISHIHPRKDDVEVSNKACLELGCIDFNIQDNCWDMELTL